MRRFLLGALVLCAAHGGAQAADADWRGVYVGGHLGYGSAKGNADFFLLGLPLFSASQTLDGFVYGAQAGYNFQTGHFVIGAEADVSGTSQKASKATSCPSAVCGISITQRSDDRIPWFGTLRGRVGFAFDRVLVYGTGGVGYGTFESTQTLTTVLGSVTAVASNQRLAWVLGGGVEAALSRNWSARAEYLYIDTGKFTTTYSLAGLPIVSEDCRMTNHVIRMGVNYRF